MSDSPHAIAIARPITVTSAMLALTNVPEADYGEYAAGATYALGDRVIVSAAHKIYESLQAANTGNTPADSPAWWLVVGPTNRWKCFDGANSTQTVSPGGETPAISYDLNPGQAISVAGILNVSGANQIDVALTDPVYGEVYSASADMSAVPGSSDWWSWFFAERTAPTQLVLIDLPAFPNATLSVALIGTVDLAVGVIMMAQQRRFTEGVELAIRAGITDYSRKEPNAFGDVVLVQRAYAKRLSLPLFLENAEIDAFTAYLAQIRAVPCLWICSGDYEVMVVFGFYKSFELLIEYEDYSDCSLDIEGLT